MINPNYVFRSICDKLRDLISSSAQQAHGPDLSPSKLIKLAVEEAKSSSVAWDANSTDVANCYKIAVSQSDWGYYHTCKQEIEARVVANICSYARSVNCRRGGFSVEIYPDYDLPDGQWCIEWEFKKADRSGTPEPAVTQFVTASARTTVKPCQTQQVYACIKQGNTTYKLEDGVTVGIQRDPSREMPDIKLSVTEETLPALADCSQIHARFFCDKDAWYVESLGINGTSIDRDGTRIECSGRVKLANGDVFYISDAIKEAFIFQAE